MRVRIVPSIAVGFVVVAALIGCGSTTEMPAPAATSSPTATLELPAARSVFSLTCEQTVALSVIVALLGDDPEVAADLDLDLAHSAKEIEERQVGVQSCRWGDGAMVSAGFAVLPHARSEFNRYHKADYVDEQYIRFDALGDASTHECSYGYCHANVLIGEHWAVVHAYRPDLMDELDLEPLFLGFARSAVAAVEEAAVQELGELWSMPEGVHRPVPGWCSDGLLAGLGGALGIPELFHPGTDGYNGFFFAVRERSGTAECGLGGESRPSDWGHLTVVPGALWAVPDLVDSAHDRYGEYATVDADVDGGQALLASNDLGSAAIFAVDGSLVFISFSSFSAEDFVGRLPAVAEAVRANGAA